MLRVEAAYAEIGAADRGAAKLLAVREGGRGGGASLSMSRTGTPPSSPRCEEERRRANRGAAKLAALWGGLRSQGGRHRGDGRHQAHIGDGAADEHMEAIVDVLMEAAVR
jgi:hypothetical protein